MPFDDWTLTVGEIVAPFGLAGEMKVRLETDFPDRFSRLRQVCLRFPDGNARLADVSGVRPHKGQILLKLRSVTSIDEAETLRGVSVQVRAQDAVRLPDNEFYIHDLIGCDVVTAEGRVLGVLRTILRSGANDIYVIGEGKNEILLPAVKDVVQRVDPGARRITVTPTPGLLPDDAPEEA